MAHAEGQPDHAAGLMPAAGLAAAAMIVCLIVVVSLTSLSLLGQVCLFILAGMVLVLRLPIGVYILLVTVFCHRLVNSFPRDLLALSDLLLAAGLVGFAACAFQYLELAPANWWGRRLRLQELDRGAPGYLGGGPRPTLRILVTAPAAVVLATTSLAVFPLSISAYRYGLVPSAVRMIGFVWLLAMAAVLVTTLFGVFAWRRLRPQQARLFLQRTVVDELSGEMSLLERRRAVYRFHAPRKRRKRKP